MTARKGSTHCGSHKRDDVSLELSSLWLLTSPTEPGYLVSSIGMPHPGLPHPADQLWAGSLGTAGLGQGAGGQGGGQQAV